MKKPRSYKLGLMTRRSLSGWLFVLPFLIGLIFFVVSPLYTALVLSFNQQVFNDVTQVTTLVPYGFTAYVEAFTEQADFINKLLESGSSVLITVPTTLIFSFLMANVLNQEFHGRTFARAVLFMPVITSAGIAASLLGGDTGVDASSMQSVGSQTVDIATSIQDSIGGEMGAFIGDAFAQLTSIINGAGVPILIFLAGLQTISPSIFESSKVEGATGWENFWKITFPMISPMILVNTVYILIENLCGMSNPMLSYLYSGGGSGSTMNQVDLMAMSWMYFLLTSIIIAAVAGIISKLVYYEN